MNPQLVVMVGSEGPAMDIVKSRLDGVVFVKEDDLIEAFEALSQERVVVITGQFKSGWGTPLRIAQHFGVEAVVSTLRGEIDGEDF